MRVVLHQARVQADLDPSRVVAITDALRVSGRLGWVVPLVRGVSLDQLVTDRPLTAHEAFAVLHTVVASLAHAQGEVAKLAPSPTACAPTFRRSIRWRWRPWRLHPQRLPGCTCSRAWMSLNVAEPYPSLHARALVISASRLET